MEKMLKTTRKKPKRWLYPLAVEREYKRLLEAYATALTDEIDRRLPLLADLRLDSIEDIPESSGWYEQLRIWVMGILAAQSDEMIIAAMKSLLQQLARFNKKQFHEVFKSVYGVNIFVNEPWLKDILLQFEAENIRLIKSIPSQYLDTLHGRIVAAVRAGTSSRDLTAFVRETYRLPQNKARLIARDQIGKLNGQLTMERQKSIGVKQYVWRTSLDERVRNEHEEREGVTFDWEKPPADGHPGEPIQCRCSAEGVYPDLADLKGFVYDGNPI